MPKVSQIYDTHDLVVSLELFPPKTPEGEAKLFEQTIPEMLKLSPAFLTCTYGAGGSTRRTTLKIVSQIISEFAVEAVAHLSCIGVSPEQIVAFLDGARTRNITNILAVRGDPPQGDISFKPHPDALKYGSELTAFIKEYGGFDILVAGYPEGHPECADKFLDWQRCVDKVEAGGNVLITQIFYDLVDFFEFDDYLKNKLGLKIPIVPGVLPIVSKQQIEHICQLCGAKLPLKVRERLELFADDNEAVRQYGVELATEMCAELIRYGLPGIHFYTLNRTKSTAEVMYNLKIPSTDSSLCSSDR